MKRHWITTVVLTSGTFGLAAWFASRSATGAPPAQPAPAAQSTGTVTASTTSPGVDARRALITRGEHLVLTSGCNDCHTPLKIGKNGPEPDMSRMLSGHPAKLPGIGAEDIGRSAYALFQRGPGIIGRSVGIAGEHLSGAEMAAALSHALGEPVLHDDISPAAFRAFAFPGADDLGNMFQFKRDFTQEFRARRDLHEGRALNPAMQTFAEWLAVSARLIPLG